MHAAHKFNDYRKHDTYIYVCTNICMHTKIPVNDHDFSLKSNSAALLLIINHVSIYLLLIDHSYLQKPNMIIISLSPLSSSNTCLVSKLLLSPVIICGISCG